MVTGLATGISRLAGVGLYPHQADGIAFLLSKKRALLADEPGLGKSRQAIAALEAAAPDGTFLVICHDSLKQHWLHEIRTVAPDASVELSGEPCAGKHPPRWTIAGYSQLGKSAPRLRATAWTGIVLDDAHTLRKPGRGTSRCLELLGEARRNGSPGTGPDHVFLLTSAPVVDGPQDLFNLLRCLGHPASRSRETFETKFIEPAPASGRPRSEGHSREEALDDLLGDIMLRRVRAEIDGLPGVERDWLGFGLSRKGTLRRQIGDFLAWCVLNSPDDENGADFDTRLASILEATGKALVKPVATVAAHKMRSGRKVVIYAPSGDEVTQHMRAFRNVAVRITGDMTAARREEAARRFQSDPHIRLAVCTIRDPKPRVRLDAANCVIFQGLDADPRNHARAEMSCQSLGQTHPLQAHYVHVTDPLNTCIAKHHAAALAADTAHTAPFRHAGTSASDMAWDVWADAATMLRDMRMAGRRHSAVSRAEPGQRTRGTPRPSSTPGG